MKILKILAVCSLLAISGQSFAKYDVTPIVFAKGSSCGSFDGNIVGRKFTLNLNANQTLTIDFKAFKSPYPIVKDSKGKTLNSTHDDGFRYETKTKGKHSVVFEVEDESYPFAEVKFCAD